MKLCKKCDTKKEESKFHKDIDKKDGLSVQCAECKNKYLRERKKDPYFSEMYRTNRRIKYRKENGIPLDSENLSKKYGKGFINSNGYRIFKKSGHPWSQKGGGLPEHKLIFYTDLGRDPFEGETIHHKNGIRDDNRIENLELWTTKHPPGQRVEDKITWAVEFLTQYGYSVSKE